MCLCLRAQGRPFLNHESPPPWFESTWGVIKKTLFALPSPPKSYTLKGALPKKWRGTRVHGNVVCEEQRISLGGGDNRGCTEPQRPLRRQWDLCRGKPTPPSTTGHDSGGHVGLDAETLRNLTCLARSSPEEPSHESAHDPFVAVQPLVLQAVFCRR